MSSPFVCACESCKAKQFPNVIRGFKHLSITERLKLAPQVSQFVKSKMMDELIQYGKEFDINKNITVQKQ